MSAERHDQLLFELRRRHRRLQCVTAFLGVTLVLGVCLGAAAAVTNHTGDHFYAGLLKCMRFHADDDATFTGKVVMHKDLSVGGKVDSPDIKALYARIESLEKTLEAAQDAHSKLAGRTDGIDARTKYLKRTVEGPNDFLTIEMGKKSVRFQSDGNLIVVGEKGTALWHSDSWQPGR